jgi:HEAT repeat protein
MNRTLRLCLCAAALLAAVTAWPAGTPPAARTGESELIQRLGASDPKIVLEALDRLPERYPDRTNALPAIKGLLKSKPVRHQAAQALASYHAELNLDEVRVILGFLRDYDPDEVMRTLQILRVLREPADINRKIASDILPLLKDPETHVVRDACRTLAVVGSKDTIPFLEPLLKNRRADIRKDAHDALDKLRAKP